MKREFAYLLAAICSLAACSRDIPAEKRTPEQHAYPLQFSIRMKKEIYSFPITRSIPPFDPKEPSVFRSEGESPDLNELCSRIDYFVFRDAESPALVKRKQYVFDPSDLDADFGIIYDTLPKGNYRFCFLAHSSNSVMLSGTTLAFDQLSDTFYKQLSEEISPSEIVHEDILLERIVSRIEFMAIDTIPAKMKRFDMKLSGRSDKFDLTTGVGIPKEEEETLSHLFKPEEVGKKIRHTLFTRLSPLKKHE